jgi:hypothetical protein
MRNRLLLLFLLLLFLLLLLLISLSPDTKLSYDVTLRCRCTAEASLLLTLWERQLGVEDTAKATEKKGIRGAIRFPPGLWTAALGIRRQQLQQLLASCCGFAKRLKQLQYGLEHEALAPGKIAFGVARYVQPNTS